MFASFHSELTVPSSSDKLNNFASGVLIRSTISLSSFGGIPSTPGNLLSFSFPWEQDLLKHTPPSHRDRVLLQMALTELETLTHKLNETKRESESRYDVKKILSNLTGRRQSFRTEESRYLVRQDHMVQVVSHSYVRLRFIPIRGGFIPLWRVHPHPRRVRPYL